jgi:glycosyltransferase involved in cell wall biosynthesis
MSQKARIIHVTTVHPRDDTRVFKKMCVDLAAEGYRVSLFVTDGLPSECKDSVEIRSLDRRRRIFARLIISHFRVLLAILSNRRAVYHFHDPELLLMTPFLRLCGYTVVLDFHEDTVEQIKEKHYINPSLRKITSVGYSCIQKLVVMVASGVVFATPAIARSVGQNCKTPSITVNNYVKVSEFPGVPSLVDYTRTKHFCYIGLISFDRCISELMDSLSYLDSEYRLVLAGKFDSKSVEEFVLGHENFSKVIYHGIVGRREFKMICQSSVCGMLLFKPLGNHVQSQPNKMWEYLVCNTRLVATNFSYWANLLSDFDEFICFSDNSPTSIATAVMDQAEKAVEDSISDYLECADRVTKLYSWETELNNLTKFYNRIVANE